MDVLLPKDLKSWLVYLLDGASTQKHEKARNIIDYLFPQAIREKLEKKGVRCIADCEFTSRKPRFVFALVRGEAMRHVSFELEKEIIYCTKNFQDAEPEALVSLHQIEMEIGDAIGAFL